MLEKVCILRGDESVDQLFRNPFIGDGDSILHQVFSDHFIFFGIDDRKGVEVSILQGCEIGQAMGVIEKEQASQDEEDQDGEDEGTNDIKCPPLFPSLLNTVLFFHEEQE